jgi:uncharacterized membrane protein YvbJ
MTCEKCGQLQDDDNNLTCCNCGASLLDGDDEDEDELEFDD